MIDKTYSESPSDSLAYRKAQLEEMCAYIQNERKRADRDRIESFSPDTSSLTAYSRAVSRYRRGFVKMLGSPLCDGPRKRSRPRASREAVAEIPEGRMSRYVIKAGRGLSTYGIFFEPRTPPPWPLVISQHGGGGTPELCSGLFPSTANYNDMTRRVLRGGCAVFAPQLLLWSQDTCGPAFNRHQIDSQLKQLGGSITAVEIFKIMRAIDYFSARKTIDSRRIGMIGLSYGGFYTLFTAAVDTRIRTAVSSCFFNDRYVYDWLDWTWKGAAQSFLDPEIAMLVCPRRLWIEVGKRDALFDVKHAGKQARRVAAAYRALRISERFRYSEFNGTHELDKKNANIDFLLEGLRQI